MEASSAVDQEQQDIEDRLDDAETIGKARQKYRLIVDLRREYAMHVERAKDTKKRMDGLQSEIEVLICDPKQLEIPTALPAPESAEPACTSIKGHTWARFREGDMLMEDCANCGLERAARVIRLQDSPDDPEVLEHEEWIYTEKEPVAS